jgi:hypothetical protein
MSDVGETTRIVLRILESLSPTTNDTTENELRFKSLIEIDNKIRRLLFKWTHAADELGD